MTHNCASTATWQGLWITYWQSCVHRQKDNKTRSSVGSEAESQKESRPTTSHNTNLLSILSKWKRDTKTHWPLTPHCNDGKCLCNQLPAQRAEEIRASFLHTRSDLHESRGPLCGCFFQIRLERSWQGLLVGERGGWSTHHDSGEAHWIFQVGFVVLQVDRTGLEWRVQSHLGGGSTQQQKHLTK